MRRAAFLCYSFPPIAGAATPRSTKFVKYLHGFSYRPTVFTVTPESHAKAGASGLDASQAADLASAEYEVVRVDNPYQNGWRLGLRKSRWFPLAWTVGYPWLYDMHRPWAFQAAKALVDAHRTDPFDLIYVSAAPNAALEAASWASRRLGIPWVADLRDLWTRDALKSFPSRRHYLWESRLERRVLRTAAAIIGNTPLAGQRLQDWLGEPIARRVTVIPNGFDSEPFQRGDAPKPPSPDDPFTIVHAGTLYDAEIRRSRLGRYLPAPLDGEARSAIPVARALVALREKHPRLASQIVIRLLGAVPESSRQAIREMGLSDQIVCEGAVPNAEAEAAVQQADALLIVQIAWEDPKRPMPHVPGKVYEYLATGSPILAPVGPGNLRDLMSEAPQAYVCDYRDPDATALAIQRLVQDRRQGRVECCDAEWLSQFDRRHLTHWLANVFDSVM